MPGQAPENHQGNTVVKKQKNMGSAYPQSDGVRSEKQWECKDLRGEGVVVWFLGRHLHVHAGASLPFTRAGSLLPFARAGAGPLSIHRPSCLFHVRWLFVAGRLWLQVLVGMVGRRCPWW